MPKKSSSNQALDDLLEKSTVEVIVKEDLKRKLLSVKKMRVKFGIDPSGTDLHIGHMVQIRKLKQFQELGHQVILLFGNFTGQIGDPTGKSQARGRRTQKELEANAAQYLDQVKIFLDIEKVEVRWNADWLSPLKFADVVELAANFTVMQMLERDMFQDRIKKNLPITLHEFLYPLMQGYDSVALKADIEIGGTEQTFNLLAGRTLQKAYGQIPQNIMTLPVLVGLDGHIKMGKSENNYIAVSESADSMYGKVMSIPDHLITQYYELATDISLNDLKDIASDLKKGVNPRDLKMRLARLIVEIYHGSKAALEAEREFVKVFQKKELPDSVPEIKLKNNNLGIVELIFVTGLVPSKNDARRLTSQGAIELDGKIINDIKTKVQIKDGSILKIGKRRFVTLRVKKNVRSIS